MMAESNKSSAARVVAMLLVPLTLMALSSCSWVRRGGDSCREPTLPQAVANHPPLRPSAGLDAPDTRNAVRVPELNEPERPRAKTDPCLSRPPAYGA